MSNKLYIDKSVISESSRNLGYRHGYDLSKWLDDNGYSGGGAADGNGIYDGSGALSSDTVVTGGAFDFTLTSQIIELNGTFTNILADNKLTLGVDAATAVYITMQDFGGVDDGIRLVCTGQNDAIGIVTTGTSAPIRIDAANSLITITANGAAQFLGNNDADASELFIHTSGNLELVTRQAGAVINLDPRSGDLQINGTAGATGSFTAQSGETITVTKGIITAITP